MLVRMQRNKILYIANGDENLRLLWKSVTVPKKLNVVLLYKLPINPTSRYIPKRSKNRYANKYTCVPNITIQTRHKEGTAPMPNDGRTGKPTVACGSPPFCVLSAWETHSHADRLLSPHSAPPPSQFRPRYASFSS